MCFAHSPLEGWDWGRLRRHRMNTIAAPVHWGKTLEMRNNRWMGPCTSDPSSVKGISSSVELLVYGVDG